MSYSFTIIGPNVIGKITVIQNGVWLCSVIHKSMGTVLSDNLRKKKAAKEKNLALGKKIKQL